MAVRCSSLAALLLSCLALAAHAQDRSGADALARRVNERMQALQREAERLAGESRTLLADLRKLEVERDLQMEHVREAQASLSSVEAQIAASSQRLADLEARRVAELPDVRARLVEMYKQRRGGYARMLLNVRDLREFGRATRAVASLASVNRQRLEAHRQTVADLRAERTALERRKQQLVARQAEAQQARAAAARAVAAREALVARIDARRDLNAQLTGELQVAQQKLQQSIASLAAGRPVELVSVPLAPFRGALDWPVVGRLVTRFGRPSGRPGGTLVRNGIEIAAPEGTPVRAVHAGSVGYADAFTGYGMLVIVDHGANHYSLYGYLSSLNVSRGDRVEAGTELGRVGSAPAGAPALYFELRAAGPSVDPVQWLKPR